MPTKRLDPELFKADLKQVAKSLKQDYLTTSEYRLNGGKFAPSTGNNLFGSWEAALNAAGLDGGAGYYAHAHNTAAESKRKNKLTADLKKQLDEAERKLKIYDKISNAAVGAWSISKHKATKHEAVSCAMASDLHWAERVDPETLGVPGGLAINEYNPTIAKARLEQFFRGVQTRDEIERSAVNISQLVLCLGGDFISGNIHPELEESNYMSAPDETFQVFEALISGIEFLLKDKNRKQIILPCVYGNHGRITPKPRVATGSDNSLETFMYNLLAKWFANEPRLKFVIAKGIHAYVEVYGLRLRFSHGDAIGYGGGVGGLTIPANKARANWNSNPLTYADYDWIGHHHTLGLHNGRLISNGSFVGYAPYPQKIKAPYEIPQQAYAVFDGKRATLSAFNPIWLTDEKFGVVTRK